MTKQYHHSMMKNKTTPSQGIRLAWLGGILDGEGTVRCYRTKKSGKIYGMSIINTDQGILNEVKSILEENGIFYSMYNKKTYSTPSSYKGTLDCYAIVVSRKNDTKKVFELLLPYLKGVKHQRALDCIAMIDSDPLRAKKVYTHTCEKCGVEFTKERKRTPEPRFCSLTCWHDTAVGKDNPNYRHGKRISGVTTEREAPLTADEATVWPLWWHRERGRNDHARPVFMTGE